MLLLLVVLLLIFLFFYSEYNTRKFCVNGSAYSAHKIYDDRENAAKTLAELDRRMKTVKNYMKKKYTCGRTFCTKILKVGLSEININERIGQYGGLEISEISPNNIFGSTSFTEGKKKMVFCLRDKKTKKIHDINLLTFVALHELAHVMNDGWGHGNNFWVLFYIILSDAVECGVYKPENYKSNPVMYCGMLIDSSPLFS